jgi:hypothetical protein
MISETFPEAKTDLQTFLSKNDQPTDLVWVFYEDVYWRNEQFFINSKSIAENEKLAEKLFELGKKRNFGIEIMAFCELGSQVGCYIFLPEDNTEAMHRLMSDKYIKYGFQNPLKKAILSKNVFLWKLFSFFNSRNTSKFGENLPAKKLAVSRLLVNH